LLIGRVNVDFIGEPKAGFDDALVSRGQVDEGELLSAVDAFASITDRSGNHGVFLGLAGHGGVDWLDVEVGQLHLDVETVVEVEDLKGTAMLVPVDQMRRVEGSMEDVVGVEVGKGSPGEDPGPADKLVVDDRVD
jgi:hypothetical protein